MFFRIHPFYSNKSPLVICMAPDGKIYTRVTDVGNIMRYACPSGITTKLFPERRYVKDLKLPNNIPIRRRIMSTRIFTLEETLTILRIKRGGAYSHFADELQQFMDKESMMVEPLPKEIDMIECTPFSCPELKPTEDVNKSVTLCEWYKRFWGLTMKMYDSYRAPCDGNTKTELKNLELVQPEFKKPEIVQPEFKKPEIVQPEFKNPEFVQPELVQQPKPEIVQPELKFAMPELVQQSKPEFKKSELVQPGFKKPKSLKRQLVHQDIEPLKRVKQEIKHEPVPVKKEIINQAPAEFLKWVPADQQSLKDGLNGNFKVLRISKEAWTNARREYCFMPDRIELEFAEGDYIYNKYAINFKSLSGKSTKERRDECVEMLKKERNVDIKNEPFVIIKNEPCAEIKTSV